MKNLSVRTRVGIAAAAITALVVVIVGTTVVLIGDHELRSRVDAELTQTIANMSDRMREPFPHRDPPPGTTTPVRLRPYDDERHAPAGDVSVALIAADGTILAATDNYDRHIGQAAMPREGRSTFRTVSDAGRNFRVLTAATDDDDVFVRVVKDMTTTTNAMHTMTITVVLVALAGIIVASGLGSIVGATAVGPIARLGEAARHVSDTDDLSVKVPETGGREMAEVAHSFNSMMQALASSRDRQARLVADAGHELRTPLTSLRTNVEVLASTPNLEPADRAELLKDVNEQIEELSSLVTDLTDLADTESAATKEFTEVDLDHVVVDAVERARRRTTSAQFVTSVAPMQVRGNRHLLERAVLNLCDNAAKWSPPGGRIDVLLTTVSSTGTTPDYAVVDVSDQGPGVAPEHREKVFDRFWRPAEARSSPGSGLGLAIVAQVARAHNGSARVEESASGGARFLMFVPLPAEPPTA